MSKHTNIKDREEAAEWARRYSLGGTTHHVNYMVDKQCNIIGYEVSDFYEYDFYADITYVRGNRQLWKIPG